MSAVSNTGPLIALAKVEQLSVLASLFGTVHIPPAVHRELLGKSGPEAGRLDVVLADWLTVASRPELLSGTEPALVAIDAGEREAIALAQSMALPLIIDDQLGRQAARSLGLMVTGTAGVVIAAKRE